MEMTTVSRDGTRIAYERSGQGPAVVLVSGAMSTGATTAPLAAELSGRFDVTVYDRRGAASGDTAPYAVEREIEDLAALIEALGGEASLYGMSSGGALVLRAAASGLPVRRVAVYEVPYAMDDAAVRAAAQYTDRAAGRGAGAGPARGRGGAVPPPHGAGRGDDPGRPAVPHVGRDGVGGAEPRVRRRRAGRRPGAPPEIAAITVPLLVLAGGASDAWWHEAARAIAEAAPDGRYGTVDRQTHMVEPGVLAPVLAEFLAG